jgi:DNA-directed RNA polymerase specialized sigma24 family protein
MSKLTTEAFEALLSSLHPGNREAAAVRYEDLRKNLIRYLDRRRCSVAEDLADATLDRVARKVMTKTIPVLAEQSGIYFLRVARFIYLEYLREEARKPKSMPGTLSASDPEDERRTECLERCLAQLPDKDRRFFVEYYRAGADERKRMAASKDISPNAVRMRVHKILMRLQNCSRRCFEQGLK